jgi:8-amino-7-oxononanoate synthase
VLDFTSSLYLGFEHPSSELPAWNQLTLGKPAALEELPETQRLERELAFLAGCEQAAVGPSTLHLFWDLFGILAKRDVRIFLDGGSYPIARWAVEKAVAHVAVKVFPQHDVKALRTALTSNGSSAGTAWPVIVTDGFCPSCGEPAPLEEYAECALAVGGLLVVDDTQALGIFGPARGASSPYGKGGGGSLRKFGLRHPRIVVISSLAKAFGVPIAMLGGSGAVVDEFRKNSNTRMHCSPPSAAVIAAARHALEENHRMGEALRSRLTQRVSQFRRGLKPYGVLASGSLFPVQPLRMHRDVDARAVYQHLLDRGIQAVLHRDSRSDAHCSFVLTARHRSVDIDKALEALVIAFPAGITSEKEGSELQWRSRR